MPACPSLEAQMLKQLSFLVGVYACSDVGQLHVHSLLCRSVVSPETSPMNMEDQWYIQAYTFNCYKLELKSVTDILKLPCFSQNLNPSSRKSQHRYLDWGGEPAQLYRVLQLFIFLCYLNVCNIQEEFTDLPLRLEREYRQKLSAIIQRILLLFQAAHCLFPAAQWYIVQLKQARKIMQKVYQWLCLLSDV